MRRIIVMLVAVAIMVAMMVATAPAFATHTGNDKGRGVPGGGQDIEGKTNACQHGAMAYFCAG